MPILLCRKEAYAAMEPRVACNPLVPRQRYERTAKGGSRNEVSSDGGDAKQPTVELAKEQNGRTDKGTVLKTTSRKAFQSYLFAKIKNCASIGLCLMMIMKTKVRLLRRLF